MYKKSLLAPFLIILLSGCGPTSSIKMSGLTSPKSFLVSDTKNVDYPGFVMVLPLFVGPHIDKLAMRPLIEDSVLQRFRLFTGDFTWPRLRVGAVALWDSDPI